MTTQSRDDDSDSDGAAQLERDILLTWRTLVVIGIPDPYLSELCLDALRAVPRDAQGHRSNVSDTTFGLTPVYEAAVMEGAEFSRGFVQHRQVPSRLGGRDLSTQDRELLQALSDGVGELSMAEQEAFRLCEIEGFSLAVVGELISLSPFMAKAQLNAAKRRLGTSRAVAGRAVQSPHLYSLMRAWHHPSDAQLEQVRIAVIQTSARRNRPSTWPGLVIAMLLSAGLLGGLWFMLSQAVQGR